MITLEELIFTDADAAVVSKRELREMRKRFIDHREDLARALAERDAWRAKAEALDRELHPLQPGPRVDPFCFGCGEAHPCSCTRAGSQ